MEIQARQITKGTISEFIEDAVPRLAAALAYYAMFSIGPLLIIVLAVAGLFFDSAAVRHEVEQQIQGFIGQKAADTLESMLSTQSHDSSVIATVLGTMVLLLGASGVFGQLQDALNTIWEVKPKPGQGIWGFIRNRFLSFAMVLGIAFLLLVSMVITTALEAFSGMISQVLPMPNIVAQVLHFSISFIVISLLFAMIFKVLPDATVKWRDVWIGAAGTSLCFTLGKFLIAMYLVRQATSSAYGAAGSVIFILLWVYYSALILFFGAEFTQVYAKKTGSRIVPSPNAVPVTEEAREQEGIPHKGASDSSPEPVYAHSRGSSPQEAEPLGNHAENGKVPLSIIASALGAGFVGGWVAHRNFTSRRFVATYPTKPLLLTAAMQLPLSSTASRTRIASRPSGRFR